MIPGVTGGDMVDIRATYAKFNGKFCLRFAIRQAVDNLNDLWFGQFANSISEGNLRALNMLPCFTAANLANRLREKVKFFRNFSVRQALVAQIQDFNNLLFGNPGVVMICAAWSAFARTFMAFSAFLVHIGHVIGLCSKKQMSRINAVGHVAMMTYIIPFWYSAKMNLPANAVSKFWSFWCTHLTVTKRHCVASPKPASLSFLDFEPKTIFYWNGFEQAGTLPTTKSASATSHIAGWYRELFSTFFANTGNLHTLFAPIKKPLAGGIGAVVSSKRTPRQRAIEAYNICARFPNYALAR